MRIRKYIAALLVLAALFAVLDVAVWYSSDESFHTEQSGEVSFLTPDGYRADTSGLSSVRTVAVRFAAPLAEDTEAFLSCGREGASERSTKSVVCPAGTEEVTFSIPQAAYLYIDVHLNIQAEIASVAVSDGAFVRVQSGYPFRPLRTLLPAALLVLLSVVFVSVPPLRRFLQATDRNVLDSRSRRKGITVGYLVFAAAVLLQHVYVTLYHKTVLTAATTLSIPLLVFAGVSLLLGKLWKDPVFWILLALWCMKIVSTALQATIDLPQENETFVLAAYAFFGAYAVARAVPKEARKNALSVFCALWTLAAAVYAAFGLYSAITGNPVPNLGTESFHILDNRLYPIYHPVTGGIILSTAMALCFIGFALTKCRMLRCFYVAASVLLFLAGSPTGARTAYVLSGVELALLLGLAAYNRLKPCRENGLPRFLGKMLVLILLMAAVTGAVALAQSYAFDAVRLTRAGAEDTIPTNELAHRGFDLSVSADDALAGRLTVWKNVLEVILNNPKSFLLGQSVHDPMRAVNELRISRDLYEVNHCHNTLLQILLENGLPGFLLYLSFILLLVFHSLQVLLYRSLPFWQRLVPIPALACLIGDLTDCTCHIAFGYPQMTLLFLFTGFTVALSREAQKAKKEGRFAESAVPDSNEILPLK